jgi:3-deoxy-D-manno-octulosonic-acid transferase/heptosyltransferase-1
LKSGVLVALARGRRKIGFGRGMEHMEHSWVFLNERLPPVDMEIHALERNLRMLEAVGIRTRKVTYGLPVADAHRRAAHRLLKAEGVAEGDGPLIAVNCVAQWPSKLWPVASFARLGDRLVDRFDARLVFTGAASDGPTVRSVLARMRRPAGDLTGKTTLKTLAALYERVRLLVSTDTGPMHLGAAVGTPVVALFGPTAPWRTGPYGERHRVLRPPLPCSPCFRRRCPSLDCMRGISVEAVFDAVGRVLAETGEAAHREAP